MRPSFGAALGDTHQKLACSVAATSPHLAMCGSAVMTTGTAPSLQPGGGGSMLSWEAHLQLMAPTQGMRWAHRRQHY